MIGSLMMRVSVVVLLIGMLAGIAMGIREDFALQPAHAHLNLVGGVLLTMKWTTAEVFLCAAVAAQRLYVILRQGTSRENRLPLWQVHCRSNRRPPLQGVSRP